ncbi:MAG: ABC-F family ATP-binding cassette domain-containing protein [Planctomycetia bacterium]|nr:ABC-F family ATP-binding cassette domain-containing protein [Planctomycetia bacterium]
MLLMSCSRLSRGFDDGPLFQDIGFELYAGDRVGLVGPNGVGKTTLLRLLAGHDRPDDGEVRLHAGARISLLQQQPDFQKGRALFDEAKSALDALLAAHDDMVRTAEQLAQAQDEAERKSLAARYDRLHELLHHHDAYNVDHRIEHVLDGLGLAAEDYRRPVETFSGGQQSRLMLAKLLLAAPDVMLLDEPSNHLDIAATSWLENYLAQQHEAMLIVSHDRYFLNRVVNKVFELSPRGLAVYPGNFEAYLKLREQRYEQEMKAWESQREYIAKQEEYIRRVHYGQLHKQAQSRQKALDKLERVERPTLISAPHMHFGDVERSGDVVLQVSDLCKAYDKPLFQDLSFQLQRGQRLGIMGPNGSGKTTLLRVLLGQEKPDSGKADIGHLVEFGYYDQHLKILPDDKEVIRAVWPHTDEQTTDQHRRDLLARFGLTGDQVYQKVGELSGGERSRVALARVVALGTNVLVLDEPTNHLDLWACESLEKALLEFEGTSIVVSHDRWFLNRVVDLLLVLEGNGRVRVIPGNYDTYELLRAQQIETKEKPAAKVEEKKVEKPKPERETRKKKRRFPYRKVEDLEAEIAKEETLLRELEQKMASPDLYREGDKVKLTTQQFEDVKVRLAQLYEHWEEAVELN